MTIEDQHSDLKSLRTITARNADWNSLARDCGCFANGSGGRLLIGIEDGETLAPAGQLVLPESVDRLRKRIGELTVSVQAQLHRLRPWRSLAKEVITVKESNKGGNSGVGQAHQS